MGEAGEQVMSGFSHEPGLKIIMTNMYLPQQRPHGM
jgi:hypothetical protein